MAPEVRQTAREGDKSFTAGALRMIINPVLYRPRFVRPPLADDIEDLIRRIPKDAPVSAVDERLLPGLIRREDLRWIRVQDPDPEGDLYRYRIVPLAQDRQTINYALWRYRWVHQNKSYILYLKDLRGGEN